MDKLIISGPVKLNGEVQISAAKNATLPILASTILFSYPVTFSHVPQLVDVHTIVKILESMGAKVSKNDGNLEINSSNLHSLHADYSLVKTMRASVLVLGPMLTKYGKASVSLPGGCAIGARPVDIHLEGLEKLGASIKIENGYIKAQANKLKGDVITLPFPSVGATENLMMAAVFAEGTTTIENAAMEPEIVDLANFLILQGVELEGAGTSRLVIQGTRPELLRPRENPYHIIGDRIEAATFIIAALMTQSEVVVKGFNPLHLKSVLDLLKKMGAQFEEGENFLRVKKSSEKLKGVSVETSPFPGFPTDVQAQMMALMAVSQGNSIITETIFENRFMHVPEMNRMGAKISLNGTSALVEGVDQMSGAPVMCTDLRASAALLLCALVAEGETHIQRIYHLDRGYEKIDEKLLKMGVKIQRVKA